MRLVIDTNILVSAFVFEGKPLELIERAIAGGSELCLSAFIRGELFRILETKFVYDQQSLLRVDGYIERNFTVVKTGVLPTVVERDPSDNNILAVAEIVRADYIISGDKDLLDLVSYQKVPIVTADQFLKVLG